VGMMIPLMKAGIDDSSKCMEKSFHLGLEIWDTKRQHDTKPARS
jgi:hypothetical protein